ncbi:MAG: carbamoyl-phosphate synthase (glutamine-hydrolyzing) large subunit [Bacteroidales bacterium]|nr:carbamoyl-phosphate synthase (glutamine-hydrolyzing) large subunit [Bacteroidales bacterium]
MKSNLKKVLVLGSGALKIGQAGEFDYSGSQALKALREEGISSVLINPNVATIQTSEGIADQVYFLPVNTHFVTEVIKKERPDGILLAFGGQTALNCGTELWQSGVLKEYGVEVLGTGVEAIMDTEDRDRFVRRLNEADLKVPVSQACETMDEALAAARRIGYPIMIRSAYALGGLGSGVCPDEQTFREVAESAFTFAPQVLVEECLKGWKEIEFEVIRDANDHCFTVASMENFDPLGIHTGESIVVAPICSLSDDQVKFLQDLAVKCVRHLNIVGECNIQYAYNADTNDYRIIEINARLSRSSALASKATGYPLAFVAAKIALGYTLDQIGEMGTTNSAYVAPSLDYLICKIPRWDLTKFQGVSRKIGSSMKSVGEVMSIGRSFEEVIQKGLRMIGQGMHGFVCNRHTHFDNLDDELQNPTDLRIFAIAQALEEGYTVERISDLTKIDVWFLERMANIVEWKHKLQAIPSLEALDAATMQQAKELGFSDFQIARLVVGDQASERDNLAVRARRKELNVEPAIKRIPTVASEHPDLTNYLYVTYATRGHDVSYYHNERSVVVLGSGAYRIGSSVEFDWCSVNAVQTARSLGYKSIMINYNPETVSTDYDMCDRLYFDELTFERVLDIYELENPHGVVVSVGGQIPNNLALRMKNEGHVKILGTSAEMIDNAEDRHKFSAMLDRIGVDQPAWKELSSMDELHQFVKSVGYPVLVRPSYVLSGAAMNVCSNDGELIEFLKLASEVSKKHPVVVSSFIQHAKEIEFDAVASKGEVLAYAISEHIEYAGVHSGDATIQFPPQKLYVETARRIKKIARKIAEALCISGPFNIQFLARDNEIKVIECNLRASRSFPFASKVLKINLIELATKVMIGEKVEAPLKSAFDLDYVGIKASQFSFNRLQKADPVLGVDMSSTGEVGCIGDNTDEAILKSMLAVGYTIPKKRILISSGTGEQKAQLLKASRDLIVHGYEIYATGGTYKYCIENGIPAHRVLWPSETGDCPEALQMIHDKQIDLVINIPKNLSQHELSNGYKIRRAAIDFNIPLITNPRLASAFITAFCNMSIDDIQIKSWDEYK